MQAEFTRRPSALAVRFRRLLLSLATIPSIACGNGGPGSVGSSTVFPDPKIAELADAAVSGDRTRVLELVRSGADPSTRGAKGVNLLQWALLNRSGAGLEALLEAGADPAAPDSSGETVVHYAAKANEPSYLDILLAGGASPDTPHGVTGATPLVSALLAEREEQFKKLLAAGANPNSPDRMGNTPLHVAGKINEPQRAIDLLQAGADPAAHNRQGATFQRYLAMTPADVLSEESRAQREALGKWLREHGVQVANHPPPLTPPPAPPPTSAPAPTRR